MSWQHCESPEQAEKAQAEQRKRLKRRAGNMEHARLIEDREAVRYHALKAKEHYGTHEGADHACTAAQLSARVSARFDVSAYDVGLPQPVAGGEIAPMEDLGADGAFYVPTLPYDVSAQLGNADLLRRSASRDRIDMLVRADALALGVECAESIGAENAAEQMLAHQMATAHALGMDFASKASLMLSGVQEWQPHGRQQVQSVEACRLAGTSAKLMKAFSDAAETLHKLRGGTPQQIIVTHVNQAVQVNEGGQVVVNGTAQAGTVRPGEGRRN